MKRINRMRHSGRLFERCVPGLLAVWLLCASSLSAYQQPQQKFSITPDLQAALDCISADSLRGHLSFIASDALEGRDTPSRGLDMAAHYIAAQFRRAGLEPVGDDGYFQTANWLLARRDMDRFEMKLEQEAEVLSIAKDRVWISFNDGLTLARAPLFRVDSTDPAALAALKPEQVQGRVVVTELADFRRESGPQRAELARAYSEFFSAMRTLKPALVISIDRNDRNTRRSGTGRLIDPDNRSGQAYQSVEGTAIFVYDSRLGKLYDSLKPGQNEATVSLRLPAPEEVPVKLRNVAGLLRGSDPTLKETYVMVTAHYDHIGVQPGGEGDTIFNGANDDGSGTVSVIETAAALGSLKQRPKRSILFMTFFGEEKGLLGSRYYGRRPIFPIEKTVADVNLEQVGRTDSSEGPQVATASLTGFDYSDVGQVFRSAGELTGINVYKHERNSDAFFSRSDNQALADQGVPAHTLTVSYIYPDYHGLGDHWEKIDYPNMEKINRMLAVGLFMIADNLIEPKWNEANPKAARYLKAWQDRRAK